jgi:acyl-CoA thioesterase
MEDQYETKIENRGLEEGLIKSVMGYAHSISVYNYLGLRVKSLGKGRAEMKMRVGEDLTNSHGRAHGGILAAFVDSAMGVAIRTLDIRVVTVEMNINYLAPINQDEVLVTDARVVHAGRSMIVAEAEVRKGDELVAKSRATFFAVKEEKK